jgi:hypothetical protein
MVGSGYAWVDGIGATEVFQLCLPEKRLFEGNG